MKIIKIFICKCDWARAVFYSLLNRQFSFGKKVSIRKNVTFYSNGILQVGNYSFINEECFLDTSGGIYVGANTAISFRVVIITGSHKIGEKRCGSSISKPVVIGDNVWVGANCTILPGTVIGSGSVVSAGSIVSGEIPCNVIYKNGSYKKINVLKI
jgi:maltose O-acetyltransferase